MSVSFDSVESFDSNELQSIGLFGSCDSVSDYLAERDDARPSFWCWETDEGDWKQILTMVMFMFGINLGMYLLTYGAITTGLSKIAGMRQTYVAADDEEFNLSTTWNATPQPIWRENVLNNTTHIPMLIIMFLLLINTILYFTIKIFIVSHPSAHYINTTNDQFHEMSFYSFFNTREIILMYIFTVNSITFWQHQTWYYPNGKFPPMIEPIVKFARLISLVDGIFTLVIAIIYYPLLLIWLYILGITILVICPLMCLVTCFVSPLAICCVVPCVECCLYGCVRVEPAVNGVIVCRCMNNCTRFLFGIMVAVIEIFLYFVVVALVLCMAFMIMDGTYGPPHIVFYMDFNSEADLLIYWMYLITISVGCIALLIGLFTMCCVDGMSHEQSLDNNGRNERRRLNNHERDNEEYEPNVLL